MKINNFKNNNFGFTFIELLVVITIIGIIFASAIVSYNSVSLKSRNTRRKADVEAIRQSLELCRSLTGTYPASIVDTVTCSNGNVLLTNTPTDPKPCPGTTYTYSRPTTLTYTLSADCMENGETLSVTNP